MAFATVRTTEEPQTFAVQASFPTYGSSRLQLLHQPPPDAAQYLLRVFCGWAVFVQVPIAFNCKRLDIRDSITPALYWKREPTYLIPQVPIPDASQFVVERRDELR